MGINFARVDGCRKKGGRGGGMFGVWVKSGYMKKGCMGAEHLKGAIK